MQGNDPLATLLFQISSPAHIPFGDQRWQELLHGYDVWVHMEDTGETDSAAILGKACDSMVKHAAVSSNLAALSLHVTRMLRQLVRDIQRSNQKTSDQPSGSGAASATDDFSKRISRVGKARATAGALQLLRLLCHPVVQSCGADAGASHQSTNSRLEEALLYHTRGDLACDQPAGRALVHSILDLITITGGDLSGALQTPEIYDATVISFQLLLVLCGTQLYQSFVSSFQSEEDENYENYVLDELLKDGSSWGDETVSAKNYGLFSASSRSLMSQSNHRDSPGRRRQHVWTPQLVLLTCMQWQIRRPMAPERSIAHYYYIMAQAAVKTRGGEAMGRDGMYESYLIVHATAPKISQSRAGDDSEDDQVTTTGGTRQEVHHRGSHNVIIDATKGALVLGSSIIMLPFRLMSLVFGVITSNRKNRGGDDVQLLARKMKSWTSSRTRDVLWLSDSILADLATSLLLLLVNNRRNGANPFRSQLSRLIDNRWDQEKDEIQGLPDLPVMESMDEEDGSMSMDEVENENDESKRLLSSVPLGGDAQLTVNFESLFEAFGRTLHTEIGALMLYTYIQSCPNFAASLGVRSDLDTLVLPLLRTLYFSSSTNTYVASDFASRKSKMMDSSSAIKSDIRTCPFRSQSQLYVIIILLLLFSQDSSFGRDAFRRITVSQVPWYKERNLRNINLGSVVLLVLLRSLMFNLQRLQDAFLLSNCCAILQNISPPIVDLHDYAAMRLASVTVSVMKKHLKLHTASTGESTMEQKSKPSNEPEGYMSTPLSMYEEVARTLLGIIHHCLSTKTVDRNLHLVYALVYHQGDFNRIFNESKLYPSKLVDRIQSVTQEAATIIQEEGARTAQKALNVLEEKIERLQNVAEKKRKKEHSDDFTFTYEEEADPEIFFVPYVWETIVCVVTSSSIEWRKDDIRVFGLLEPVDEMTTNGVDPSVDHSTGQFAKDVDELV